MNETSKEETDIDKLEFKEAMERLERINDRLERNKVSLEEAIELYQQGTDLIEHCRDKLDQAEGKIKKITSEEEEIIEEL